MHDYVIVDASVLIIFDKLDQLQLLRKIYQTVITTPEIADEYNKPLPEWITIESVNDKKYQVFIETIVDRGEASAIALAVEKTNTLLLLDDLKARKLAKRLNLRVTGTLGVISKAKSLKLIEKIKPLLDQLEKTDFRISKSLIETLLKRNGEL